MSVLILCFCRWQFIKSDACCLLSWSTNWMKTSWFIYSFILPPLKTADRAVSFIDEKSNQLSACKFFFRIEWKCSWFALLFRRLWFSSCKDISFFFFGICLTFDIWFWSRTNGCFCLLTGVKLTTQYELVFLLQLVDVCRNFVASANISTRHSRSTSKSCSSAIKLNF